MIPMMKARVIAPALDLVLTFVKEIHASRTIVYSETPAEALV